MLTPFMNDCLDDCQQVGGKYGFIGNIRLFSKSCTYFFGLPLYTMYSGCIYDFFSSGVKNIETNKSQKKL